MAVTLRSMTQHEFQQFYTWSIAHHTAELMKELQITEEEAAKEAAAEVAEMLPEGIHTRNHHLMTVVETATGENAGFVWTIHEEFEGKKQSFLCDFAIWEAKRRRGYAAAALDLTEQQAKAAGCCESVLFVSDDNEVAGSLYRKSGYRVLRQHGYGKFMVKQLA